MGRPKVSEDDPRKKSLHSFRIENEIWEEGMEAAEFFGSDLSTELRNAVQRLILRKRRKVAADKAATAERRRLRREQREQM